MTETCEKTVKDIGPQINLQQKLKELKSFKHPNILPVLDSSRIEGGNLVIVTEKCETNLREFMDNKILGLNDIWEIGRSVLDGLNYLHNVAKIPHESIKPRNIVRLDGVWKLAHFGLVLGKPKVEEMSVSSIAGDHVYKSPEEAQGGQNVDAEKADVFRFGAVLYFMHENKMPFNGTHLSLGQAPTDPNVPDFRRFDFKVDQPRQVNHFK